MLYKSQSPKILTSAETTKLLQETGRHPNDLRDHLIFSIALGCGLRLGEIVGLNLGDIYNGRGIRSVVTLRPEITKGTKEGNVVLPSRLRRKLFKFVQWKSAVGQPDHAAAPLFISRGGGRSAAKGGNRLSRRGAQRAFEAWQQRLGFDRRLNFHAMRHTAMTNLWRSTRDLRLVQIAARHASPSTTARYSHPNLDDLAEAVERLPC
jgi:integrase/recombinase XerC